jgi:hypothetical protein
MFLGKNDKPLSVTNDSLASNDNAVLLCPQGQTLKARSFLRMEKYPFEQVCIYFQKKA